EAHSGYGALALAGELRGDRLSALRDKSAEVEPAPENLGRSARARRAEAAAKLPALLGRRLLLRQRLLRHLLDGVDLLPPRVFREAGRREVLQNLLILFTDLPVRHQAVEKPVLAGEWVREAQVGLLVRPASHREARQRQVEVPRHEHDFAALTRQVDVVVV